MNTFITRTLTAAVFAAVMLGGVLYSPFSFFLLFLLIGSGALWEFTQMAGALDYRYGRIGPVAHLLVLTSGIGIITCFAGAWLRCGNLPFSLIGKWILCCSAVLYLLTELTLGQPGKRARLLLSGFGLVYISASFGLLVDLRLERPYHGFPLIPLGLILLIWINDTMAYIVGSLAGRTPFFPSISPKKTWEGTLGGALLTVIGAGLFGWLGNYYTVGNWIVLGGLVAVLGTTGDLFESRLKRMAGWKDSGRLMPGHGGLLDRFDSLLFVIPFAWVYVFFFI
ncbi:MAG TPA: phosphatidate cytidylyltransferase [Chitinophagaceae bacterium]|nr:phosphatidate cytidylyltransferase [Chitinophagaceae bacterium]